MKNAFRLSFIALMLVCLSAGAVVAQTPTPTPTPRDSSFAQITSSSASSFVGGMSGNGRYVVFESTGDLRTVMPGEVSVSTRAVSNPDANREIFLYDYAQRRVFQITNTTSARVDATKPALSVNTTTGFLNYSNVDVEVSNNRPYISRDGRWIVFSSNADTPFNFDGDANKAALKLDGNQEVFLYRIPNAPTVDLRSGTATEFVDLRVNDFARVTDTAASRAPVAGTEFTPPFVADDNRAAQVNDRASRVVFISTRNKFSPSGAEYKNADANPDVFVWSRTSPTNSLSVATGVVAQVTSTSGTFTFTSNPNISGGTLTDDGAEDSVSVIAFISNATSISNFNDTAFTLENADGNEELFVARFDGAVTTSLTQATRTQSPNVGGVVNVLNPGPRLSRDGKFLGFESAAANPAANATTNEATRGLFVYVTTSNTLIQVGPRAASTAEEDTLRFPVFAGTGDNTQLVYTSALNFTPTGTRLALGDVAGFNPLGFKQIYSVRAPSLPADAQTFTRLSNTTVGGNAALQPYIGNTTERIAFTFNGELGGGNGTATGESPASSEVFYLLVPPIAPAASDIPASASALAYFTGATERPVVTPAASPTPTPSPTPAATPITGLAPGMIGTVRKTAASGSFTFATAAATNGGASESRHRPSLPVELAGVTLSVNNAAAGLYFVSPTEIQFVVPPGLTAQTGTATYPVVINVNEDGAVRTIRSVLQVVAAQPDIYSTTNGPGGRAVIGNATNPLTVGLGLPEPFGVMTTYTSGSNQTVTAQTRLRVMLTGVRGIPRSAFTVRLVKADGTVTDIAPGDQIPTDPMIVDTVPGAFTLDFLLPASLANAGDVSIIVSVTVGGQTFTSRPVDTAPKFRIN